MTASETLHAFESHLITETEAVEQALCERLNEVYEQAASENGRDGRPLLREKRYAVS